MAVVWSKDLGEKKSELMDWLVKLSLDEVNLRQLERLDRETGGAPAVSLRAARNAVSTDLNGIARTRLTLRIWKVSDREIKDIEKEATDIVGTSSKKALDRLMAARRKKMEQWARVEIRAPFDGVIIEKNLTIGNLVDPSADLFKVADLDSSPSSPTPMKRTSASSRTCSPLPPRPGPLARSPDLRPRQDAAQDRRYRAYRLYHRPQSKDEPGHRQGGQLLGPTACGPVDHRPGGPAGPAGRGVGSRRRPVRGRHRERYFRPARPEKADIPHEARVRGDAFHDQAYIRSRLSETQKKRGLEGCTPASSWPPTPPSN